MEENVKAVENLEEAEAPEELVRVPDDINPFLAAKCEVCGTWYSRKSGTCPACGDPKEMVVDDWIGYIVVSLSCLLSAVACVNPLIYTVALYAAIASVIVSILVIVVSYVKPGEEKQWPMLLISMVSLLIAYLVSTNAMGR